MSMQNELPFDGLCQSTFVRGCGPYEPSIASSASSSQASIFSDASSTQSSIASSISDDFRQNQEDARDRAYAQAQIQQKAVLETGKVSSEHCKLPSLLNEGYVNAPSYADVTSVPKEQRQHPRRCSLSGSQKPPTLQRQCERKIDFVESLVALYYLVLIKPFIPKTDFTQEQRMDCPATRALMCGRRMFLAALILASKYLQDRNYSAKAWSKMSGLKVSEINTNERTFLSKVQWKLHIPDPTFKKWTEIVLKYTPDAHPPSPGQSIGISMPSWKSIVPILTPELDNVPLPELKQKRSMQCLGNYGHPSPGTLTPRPSAVNSMQLSSMSHESTPTPLTVLPRFLEPKPDMAPPTPALARMGPLPTPQLTPSSVASSTPAASVCGSRRPSMSCAMAMAQQAGFNRCAVDTFPGKENFNPYSRRPSITSAASSRSSPESMISDRSRSSRASSISSVSTVSSTSSLAPNRACLARQATCRNARLQKPFASVAEEKEGTAKKPIVINDDVELVSSPDMTDFSISEKVLSRPDKHSKHGSRPMTALSTEKGRKRPRSWGNRRSDLQEEVRLRLEEAEDIMDIDDDVTDDIISSPSPAADYASRMLSRSNSVIRTKEMQPPASLSRGGSCRMPVQRHAGSKRTCCSTSRMSTSPAPLYGGVA
ncbi:PHO85 cyclin-5 [Vermiconidia calcicola]|uniref:PHO85 cyclin-5 n=1 Tax=Vermiconidia calcicola TaxID=1690605 RepID=A0ACC3N2S0_9PEZI|nr:PHO85 cyclin-5 [Vermiconidia calcicola]